MVATVFLALWLQMSAQPQIVKFPCPEGRPVGIVLGNNQIVDGSSVSGYPCPFSTKGRKVVNTTIDGVHYEWCQTRQGNTECKKATTRAEQTAPLKMYESMCRLPRLEYGERYMVFTHRRECFIFEKNFGEVFWQGPHGEEILFDVARVPNSATISTD